MNNKLFQGLLIGSLVFQGVVIFSADAATPNRPKLLLKKPAKPVVKPAAKPETKPEAEPPVVISKTTIQDNGVRYELTGCRREGAATAATVVCRFLVTNRKKSDVAASLKVAGTRFIDRDGEEYLAKEVKLGSIKSETEAENTLISDIPTKATVTFDAPAVNVSTMRVLAINHSPGNTLKFLDMKIGK
jgi:hypothetical protein